MARPKRIPMRKCIGCEQMKAKRELVRIVRTPEGHVELDLTGKRSGRGAYVCPTKACLELAVRGKRLAKALQGPVDQDVVSRIQEEIQGREGSVQVTGSGSKSP